MNRNLQRAAREWLASIKVITKVLERGKIGNHDFCEMLAHSIVAELAKHNPPILLCFDEEGES